MDGCVCLCFSHLEFLGYYAISKYFITVVVVVVVKQRFTHFFHTKKKRNEYLIVYLFFFLSLCSINIGFFLFFNVGAKRAEIAIFISFSLFQQLFWPIKCGIYFKCGESRLIFTHVSLTIFMHLLIPQQDENCA